MGAAKPVLGYPTRTAAMLALAAEGLKTRQIAARISAADPGDPMSALKVSRLLHAGRRRSGRHPLLLSLPADLYGRLSCVAAQRRSRADHLARRLIEAALADILIDAILNDGGDT